MLFREPIEAYYLLAHATLGTGPEGLGEFCALPLCSLLSLLAVARYCWLLVPGETMASIPMRVSDEPQGATCLRRATGHGVSLMSHRVICHCSVTGTGCHQDAARAARDPCLG